MNEEQRAESIKRYFTAADDEDFDVLEPVLTDNVQFLAPGGEISGTDAFREYLEEDRAISNSTHELTRTIHIDAVSVSEGQVTGETPQGRVKGAFCDVFEFNNDDRIESISVYTRI